jgi:hypothetical protein
VSASPKETFRARCLSRLVQHGGTGATFGLCDCTIERDQVEYEFTGPSGVTFHFDMRCHAIWQLAAAARIDGPVAS